MSAELSLAQPCRGHFQLCQLSAGSGSSVLVLCDPRETSLSFGRGKEMFFAGWGGQRALPEAQARSLWSQELSGSAAAIAVLLKAVVWEAVSCSLLGVTQTLDI